ncbi:MAG: DUF1801 domain-containing protein [Chloroflexota bacterium]|nr:DUF1801 domain-containing protein [Chloroflexota bacterium]
MATRTKKKLAAKTASPKTVEAYLAAAPKEHRAALMKLRQTIKAAAPKATEGVSYGMAGFKQSGKYLMTFGYWKEHFALYGGFDAFAAELEPYDQSGKGTVRFPADEPLPYGLVTRIIKARVAEIEKAG